MPPSPNYKLLFAILFCMSRKLVVFAQYHLSLFCISLGVLCLCGCTEEVPSSGLVGEVPRHSINLKTARKFSFAEFFDTLEYVPLTTGNDQLLLGDILSVKVFEQYIAVIDNPGFAFSRLSVFDKGGKLIAVINLEESGPERLININDVWINPDAGKIFVLDLVQQKIIEYQINGRFSGYSYIPSACAQFVLPSGSRSVEKVWLFFDNQPMTATCEEGVSFAKEEACKKREGTPPGKFLKEQMYNVRHVDLATCEMHGGAPIRPSLLYKRIGYPFFSNYNEDDLYFYYNTWFCDTVFTFDAKDPESFRPMVSFDFGRYAFTISDERRFAAVEDDAEKLRLLNISMRNKVRHFDRVGYSDNRLWVRFGCNGTPYLISVLLNSGETQPVLYKNERRPAANDWDLMTFLPVEVAFTENGVVFKLPAHRIEEFIEESSQLAKQLLPDDIRRVRFERAKNILMDVSRDDNPVLIFAYWRKDKLH